MRQVATPPSVILIMGVSGCGKSTAGEGLSKRLGWPFRDADSFHPPANIAKMSQGLPLIDEDRWPWLEAIGLWMDERVARGETAIVTCSALRRIYRDVLIGDRDHVALVHLDGTKELIGARMARRTDHFMPTTLLDSQFATLEPPGDDERPLRVPVAQEPDTIVEAIIRGLGL
jgi:gluconokinase